MGICSDRQFLGLVDKVLPGWFPHLPAQSQYNRRLRALTPKLVWVQQRLSELLADGELRLADGTLSGWPTTPAAPSAASSPALAAYGYCPAKSHYSGGVRLVLVTDPLGLPLGYTLVAANEKEYEPVRELTSGQRGSTLIADKGLWGRDTPRRCACRGSRSAPPTGRTAANTGGERRPRRHAPRDRVDDRQPQMPDAARATPRQDPSGLVQRIAQRLLALTLGMLLNALTGRPPRSLVAYDGR